MPGSVNEKAENNLSKELLQDDLELSITPQENDEWLQPSNQKQRSYGQEESDENEGWEELVDEWLAESEELKLTEDQMELNNKLLHSLRRLGFYVGERYYSYTGAPVFEEFLAEHKDDNDLKVVLNLQRGESKTTILHEVAQYNIEATSALLDAGADPNIPDIQQRTPLHYVAEASHSCVVGLLLGTKGVDINAGDDQGKTPLHYAVSAGYKDVVDNFLNKEAGVSIKDKNGYTAFHYAIEINDLESLKALVYHAARSSSAQEENWESKDKNYWYELSDYEKFEIQRCEEKAKELLSRTVDKKGNTLLHWAAQHVYEKETLKFLVEKGVDINAENKYGVTPAHIAARCGNEDFIDFLIESQNIECIKKDINGWTPIDIARRTACDENCKPEERERACRVIEKLAKFSDIETPKPKGVFNKTVENLKKMWTSNFAQATNEDKKTTSILDNTARSEKLLNSTESSLPLDDSFYNKINSSIKDSSKRWKRSGGNVSMFGLTRRDLEKLDKFSSKVKKAKDVAQLSQIIDEALQTGIRLKFYKNNFVNLVMDQISQLNGVVQNPQVVSSIVCKLASKGADVKEEINEELEDVFKDHNANMEKAYFEYEKLVNDFRAVAASALSSGKVANVEIDNKAVYSKYSQDSVVDAATVAYGAKRLGCTEGTIAFDGKNEIRFEVQDGVRNYVGLSDEGSIALIFQTSLGALEVMLRSDGEKIRVIVSEEDRENLKQLKDKGKDVGKNCLLWGLSVYDAIIKGYFERSGKFQSSETISCKRPEPSETVSFPSQDFKGDVEKIMEGISSADIKNAGEESLVNIMQGKRTSESCSRRM